MVLMLSEVSIHYIHLLGKGAESRRQTQFN